MVREAFGFSSKEKLLLDERLYVKSWKSNPDKTEEEEEKEEDEVEVEEVTVEELAGLVEESNLQGRDLRNIVRAEEELNQCDGFQRLLPRPEGLRFLRYLGRCAFDRQPCHLFKIFLCCCQHPNANKLSWAIK